MRLGAGTGKAEREVRIPDLVEHTLGVRQGLKPRVAESTLHEEADGKRGSGLDREPDAEKCAVGAV